MAVRNKDRCVTAAGCHYHNKLNSNPKHVKEVKSLIVQSENHFLNDTFWVQEEAKQVSPIVQPDLPDLFRFSGGELVRSRKKMSVIS